MASISGNNISLDLKEHLDHDKRDPVTFAIVDTSPELRFIGPFAQRFSAKVEPCLISPPIPAQAARGSMK